MSEAEKQPLHVALRPQELEDVVGQDAVCNSIRNLFASGRLPHCFLFTGPTGTGKTTLARIIARLLECDPNTGVVQSDAGRYSGADEMRDLIKMTQYGGLGSNARRMFIIEECHALSKQAWNALLLATEEPPPHLFWGFCTTEPEKIPAALFTRAHSFSLKPIPWEMLCGYMEEVAKVERLKVRQEFIEIAARKAGGSMRLALVFLSKLDRITERGEALQLLDEAESKEGGTAIELARMVVSNRGFTWANARKLLEGAGKENAQSIRITVVNYASAALLKTESEKEAVKLCAIIQAFSEARGDGMTPLLLAVGALLFGG